MSDRNELIITALQQKIGELVSNYETQIAILRAELTIQSAGLQDKSEAVEEYEYEDDEDEDMWLGDIGDEYMDEDILIQFLNEYYVVFPKKLPEAESE